MKLKNILKQYLGVYLFKMQMSMILKAKLKSQENQRVQERVLLIHLIALKVQAN